MAAPSPDQFDAYFRAADLNHDGRITGDEAVAFFKGSNLPQQVLAQVWTFADQNRKGFLGRPEFYNALRLVTVAQTGRQLTPDIVKSALYGPAASQIPAPRINFSAAAPVQVPASTPARPPVPAAATQVSGGIPTQPNLAHRAITPQQQPGPNAGVRPMGPSPLGMSQKPPLVSQNNHVQTTPNLTTDWFSGKRNLPPTGAPPAPVQAHVQVPSVSQITNQVVPHSSPVNNANTGFGLTSGGEAKDSKALVVSGNGFTSSSTSSAPVDPFAAFSPIQRSSTTPASGNQLPPKQQTGVIPPVSMAPSAPVVSNFSTGPTASGAGTVPPVASSVGAGSPTIVSGVGTGPVAQAPWPKIMQSDVQKYMAVFIKVDKDRDGKITGHEARNLFLSWKLPREVLKKVWDLSDQDKDGMLSFREFCTAVYLMERNREHRPLPDQLPADIWSDGVSLPSTGQFSASNTSSSPQQVQGFAPQGVQAGPRSMMMQPGLMRPPPRGPPESDGIQQQEPPKSKIPVLEKHLVDQLSKEEQTSLSSKFQEASDAEKKVQELEKEIMESREKTEFYRTKMQELILYKSRCDNRLNEISERVSSDKREVVSLSKKYEDKCKQLGDVASRLTLEEATFRDVQEKKMEIYNAILKLQKGDKADDSAQERASKIQSDIEEIMKTLNDKCKTYGLRTKPTTITELPFGWQPGILQTADEWDEEWDKFEDGGFTIIKELTVEIEKPKKEPQLDKTDKKEAATTNEASPESSKETKDEKTQELPVKERAAEGDSVISSPSADDKKVQSPKSVPSSPAKKSPKKGNNDVFDSKFKESSIFHDGSPRASESISDRDGAESSVSGDKFEHSWGPSFDHADDAESTWNFSDKDNESINNDLFFGGANLLPIKTGSSSNTGGFGRESKPFFDSVPSTPMTAVYNDPPKPFFDSVPSTPMSLFGNNGPQRSFFDSSVPSTPMYSNSGFSPRYSEAGDDNSFDNIANNFDTYGSSRDSFSSNTFGRFDSFRSSTDQGFGDSFGRFDTNSTSDQFGDQFGSEKTFARFDSMRSTSDPFDTSDPFGSSEPFGTSDSWGAEKFSRYDSMKSTTDQTGSDKFTRFDSMRSTTDMGYSFDDHDMFGSGTIKFSDDNSPRHGTDNWSAF